MSLTKRHSALRIQYTDTQNSNLNATLSITTVSLSQTLSCLGPLCWLALFFIVMLSVVMLCIIMLTGVARQGA